MSEQQTIDRQQNRPTEGDDQASEAGSQGHGAAPHVSSTTPENKTGTVNPSAPEDSNTTPGSTNEK